MSHNPVTAGQPEAPAFDTRLRVLFVCVHNSARSIMAEAWLNHAHGDRFAAESAGLEPGQLNPRVVRVMAELGLDVSGKRPQAVFPLVQAGRLYRYVIAVCERGASERCPVFAGVTERLAWSFPDPSGFTGPEAEVLDRTREVRDAIRRQIDEWVATVPPGGRG